MIDFLKSFVLDVVASIKVFFYGFLVFGTTIICLGVILYSTLFVINWW